MTCAGGYLANNHIGLLGLTRFGEGTGSDCAANDWATAVNIRFQRGRETVDTILDSSRQGGFQTYLLAMAHQRSNRGLPGPQT